MEIRRSIAGLSLLALLTSLVGFSAVAYAQSFSDVDTDHWAYESVEDLYAQGVVEGYEDGTFGCDSTANRAEFSKMVALAFGFDTETDYDAGFSDVAADAWYAPYVNTLAQNGVVAGYTDADGEPTGEFGPGDTVNRAAAAKMLMLAGGLEEDTSYGPSFSDVEEGAWYYGYVETLYANSVVDGYGDGTYGPGDNLTRCQLAKMVVGTQNPVAREVVEEEEEEEVVEEEEEVEASSGSLAIAAGDEVAGGTVPKGATAVDMLNIDVTAADEDIVLSELVFSRGGVGSSSDFSNMYLYDGADRLTTGRTVSSSTNTVTFSALRYTVEAGETATLTLVADYSASASTGNVDYFSLVSGDYVTHNGVDTDGDFPITGEEFTVGGATAGSVAIDKTGTLSNPTVGEQGAEIGKFKLTAYNEDIWVNRLALRVRGSISNSLLSNFVLYEGSTEIATVEALNSSDLMVFVLDTPIEIEKGNNSNFTVTGDIGAADANDTILIDLDEDTDLVAVGEVYGFGAQVISDGASTTPSHSDNGYDGNTTSAVTTSCTSTTWDDASCTAVEGGQVTLSFSGPAAMNVAVNSKDVTVFEFAMTSAVDVEVRNLDFRLTAATSSGVCASGDHGCLLDGTSTANYSDIKLIDTDTGATVGSSTEISTSGLDTYQDVEYTDTFYIDAGETVNLGIQLDIANNTNMANDTFYVTLLAVSTSDGVRDVATSDYVTDIVPSGNITGNSHTVLTSSLSLALASSPANDTVVKGVSDVESVGVSFTAGQGSDINVNAITLTGYVNADVLDEKGDSSLDSWGTSVTDEDAGTLYPGEVLGTVELYDGEGNLLSTSGKSFSATGTTLSFTGLDWTIEAGQTEKLVVVADVYNNSVGSYKNGYAFGIASGGVTAYNEDDSSITVSSTVNTSQTRYMTIADAGTVTVAAADSQVLDGVAVAGADSTTDPLLVAKYKAYANYEDYKITEMAFDFVGTDDDAVNYVILKYPTSLSDPDTLDGTAQVNLVSNTATFTGLSAMVPVSDTDENAVELELYVTTNAVGSGADSADQLDFNLDDASGFKAVGQSSSSTVTTAGISSAIAGNEIALYKSLPTFATYTSNSKCPSSTLTAGTSSAVYCFSVSSSAPVGLYKLTLDATPSSLNTGTGAGQLGVTAGWNIYNINDTSTSLGSGTWASNVVALTFTSEEVVNGTNYYIVKAPVSFDSSRSVAASLSISLADETVTTHATPAAAASATGLNIWSDRTATSHTTSTSDWVNGYRFESLPTSSLALSES